MSTATTEDAKIESATTAEQESNEYPFMLPATVNQAGRDLNGVQAGSIFGSVTYHHHSASAIPELMVRRATAEEMDQLHNHFIHPKGFGDANRILSCYHVVILYGKGAGRTFAGRRLLHDQGVSAVIDLNVDRVLRSIQDTDLRHNEGYLWDVGGSVDHPFTDWEFHHVASLMREASSWLVIVLDSRRQAPGEASGHTVKLSPPEPLEVAMTSIDLLSNTLAEQAKQVLKRDLSAALTEHDPPQKALRAALLAVDVADGKLGTADALQSLNQEAENAVAIAFESWSLIEHSMLLAVALLEDQPLDEVVQHAKELDDLIRKAELPEDKPLRPRRIFATPTNKVLEEIRARTVVREHPRHPGLREKTVSFIRHDWAHAVLRHVWREYPVVHEVLGDWMCTPSLLARFRGGSERALCTLITEVPAHDPLRLLDRLAARPTLAQRELVVGVLNRLAHTHNLEPLVEQTLEDWVESGTINRKWTAAVAYGSEFGQRNPSYALRQLERVGRSNSSRVQSGVIRSLLVMLSRPETEKSAIEILVPWLWSFRHGQPDGLRMVALGVGIWATGFIRDPEHVALDPASLAERYPEALRTLAEHIVCDSLLGPPAVAYLSRLMKRAELEQKRQLAPSNDDASAELLRLVSLLTPNLRWSTRRKRANELAEQHPIRRSKIRRIFKMASQLSPGQESTSA